MGRNTTEMQIIRLVADIDSMVRRQLESICNHPDVMELQASWLGLHWLVKNGAITKRNSDQNNGFK